MGEVELQTRPLGASGTRSSGPFAFTSESVSEGHPDKVADAISDAILDAHLARDRGARVACEALVKSGLVVVAGEITSAAEVDLEAVVRDTIRRIGYVDPADPFHADGVEIRLALTRQAPEIGAGVSAATDDGADQGAGDQGMMFGYACRDTESLMPLPIHLAHALTRTLAAHRRAGRVAWLRPDAKSQVTVEYAGWRPRRVLDVLVSTQHAPGADRREIEAYAREALLPEALGPWFHPGIRLLVNPSGSFVQGGPNADCGLTGRKIIVDTYGGMARHGGGAFSGKDPSKVDRAGAYFCRFVARELVAAGLAERAELQVSYAIGRARPVSVMVETFGTGDPGEAAAFVRGFDFRPRAMIERLDLLRPIYSSTTNYGHFGKSWLPWG